MSTSEKMQYMYEIKDQQKIEKPIKLIHPLNMDNQYQQIQTKHEISKQQLKQFEQCPYYIIRDLVTTFLSNRLYNYHNEYSDLLNQKYQFDKNAKGLDYKLQFDLRQYRRQKKRHQKIQKVLIYYKQQNHFVKEEMMYCIEAQNSYNSNDKTFLNDFQNKFLEFQNINNRAKQAQTRYFNLKSFGHFLSNACILITQIKQPNTEFSSLSMNQYLKEMTRFKIDLQDQIQKTDFKRFQIRQNVKFSDKSVLETMPNKLKQITDHYAMLVKFPNAIRMEFEKLRPLYQRFMNAYSSYLKKYKDYEQINIIKKNADTYNIMINKQKNNLTNHLKLHYELLVTFTPSKQYTDFEKMIQSKNYAKLLYNQKIVDIKNAINFVNVTYNNLFKQICNNQNSVRRQIQNQIKKFNNANKQDKYNIIILQNLRKLSELSIS